MTAVKPCENITYKQVNVYRLSKIKMTTQPRVKNFSKKEIVILVESAKNFDVLFAKQRTAGVNSKKIEAYALIARQVSALGVAHRTPQQISHKLQDLRSSTKCKAAAKIKHRNGTGGGPPVEDLTQLEESILSMVPEVSYAGIPGSIDTQMLDESEMLDEVLPHTSISSISLTTSSTTCEKKNIGKSNVVCDALNLQRENNQLLIEIRDLLKSILFLKQQR
jgi:hypothetical protein